MTGKSKRASRSPGGVVVPGGFSLVAACLTGCPVGANLDTPYREYAPPPDGGGTMTSTTDATSTTAGPGPCSDDQVNEVFASWCGGAPCHGNAGTNDATTPDEAPFWIYSPTRATDWIGQPGTLTAEHDCTAEVIINGSDPSQSLLLSSVKHTSLCGQEMPYGYPLVDGAGVPLNDEYAAILACLESWVNSVVATQAGAVAPTATSGTSGL